MLFVLNTDCSHKRKRKKEKVSIATLKHLGVDGEVCEQREQEEWIDSRRLWKKVDLLGSCPFCSFVTISSSP